MRIGRFFHGIKIVLMAVWCMAVFSALHAGTAAGSTASGLSPCPSPDELIDKLDGEFCETGSWFVRERDDLLFFALGSGGSIAVGALLLWLLRRRRGGDRYAGWHREVLRAFAAPGVLLAVLVSCFRFSRPLLKSMTRRFYEWDMRFFYAALTLVVAWGVIGAVSATDRHIRRFAERSDNSLDDLTVGMIGTTFKVAVAVTVLLFVCQNIFDLNITALLAGAGVIGLAVALAAKDTISNFFGTLVIVADSPFRLGDRIRAGEVDGVVLHVGMRSSKILTEDDSVCTVPNSMLTNTVVSNLSRRGYLKHVLDIGLTYDTAPERMEQAIAMLHDIMDGFHGQDAPEYAPRIFFSGFSASSIDIRAIIWFKAGSFREEEQLLDELNTAVLGRFAAAGLSFAYPTQTVYVADASTT